MLPDEQLGPLNLDWMTAQGLFRAKNSHLQNSSWQIWDRFIAALLAALLWGKVRESYLCSTNSVM